VFGDRSSYYCFEKEEKKVLVETGFERIELVSPQSMFCFILFFYFLSYVPLEKISDWLKQSVGAAGLATRRPVLATGPLGLGQGKDRQRAPASLLAPETAAVSAVRTRETAAKSRC